MGLQHVRAVIRDENKLSYLTPADRGSSFRAFRPQYFLPLIVFSIFINVTATYGCIFPTMEQAYTLSTIVPLIKNGGPNADSDV